MARKVFISVLGAGLYESCVYSANGFYSTNTRFVQKATLEYLKAQEWSNDCIAYFLLTDKARNSNWIVEENQRYNNYLKKNVTYSGLLEELKSAHLPFMVEDVSIPDGKDENEMWQIFESTYKLLEDGDELYFDLTHSFRYLPMLILVLGNYAKFLKNATVCSITYGNYEARNQKTNVAPIVDLLPLSSLQDWTFATADFLKNGYVDRLVELSDKGLRPLLLNDGYKNPDINSLRQFVSHLKSFTSDMQTCRGLNVIEASSVKKIKQDIESLHNVVIPQLDPVLQQVHKSIEPFDENNSVINAFMAAQWCYDNQQYQQATTFLEEGIISYFCLRYGIALDNRNMRGLIPSAFNVIGSNIPKEKWSVCDDNLFQEIVDDLVKDRNLVNSFNSLATLRNDYNHCGMRNGANKSEQIKRKIKQYLDTIIPLLNSHCQVLNNNENKSYLINFSNHPSELWGEKQLNAAKIYGEIKDIAFPAINPEACDNQIEELADQYIKEILSLKKEGKITVHIMGELTFTFMVVSQLKAMGIKCIASTSERNAEDMTDGRKISDFQFVRFRSY